MQERELLDDVVRTCLDVIVGRTGKPAPGRDEILEHHHVVIAVGLRVPDARHPYRDLAREVAVEARFRDAHARHVDERTLLLAEGWELHEHGRWNSERHRWSATRARPGGSGAPVEHCRLGNVAIEDARRTSAR